MKKLSITTKITLWYTMFLIVVAVILMVVLYRYYDFREQSTAEQQIIQTIEDTSDRISTNGPDYAKNGDIGYYTKDTYISVYQKDGAFFAGLLPDGTLYPHPQSQNPVCSQKVRPCGSYGPDG